MLPVYFKLHIMQRWLKFRLGIISWQILSHLGERGCCTPQTAQSLVNLIFRSLVTVKQKCSTVKTHKSLIPSKYIFSWLPWFFRENSDTKGMFYYVQYLIFGWCCLQFPIFPICVQLKVITKEFSGNKNKLLLFQWSRNKKQVKSPGKCYILSAAHSMLNYY